MPRDNLWMPLDVADYLADTMHLTTVQHGAYLLLLMHYWRNGPLVDDPVQCCLITRTDPRVFARHIWPVVKCFFSLGEDGLLHQKRSDHERAHTADVVTKRRAAARARWTNGKDEPPPSGDANAHANAFHVDKQTPSTSNANGSASGYANAMQKACTHAPAVHHTTKKDIDPEVGSRADHGAVTAPTASEDVRSELWNEGVPIVRAIVGLPLDRARRFVGKLLRDADDDCARVLWALRQARDTRSDDPQAWIIAACGGKPKRSVYDTIREELGGGSFLIPGSMDEDDEPVRLTAIPGGKP